MLQKKHLATNPRIGTRKSLQTFCNTKVIKADTLFLQNNIC